jgi:hypothetical protein
MYEDMLQRYLQIVYEILLHVNMAMVRNLEIICDKFNFGWSRTTETYAKKWMTKSHH